MMHQSPPEGRQSENRTYPEVPGVRKGAPSTSHEAATAIAPMLGRLQKMVRRALQEAGTLGLTADEIASTLQLERWTVQPRTSELKALGLILDSGERRRNVTGKRAVVWIAAEFAPKPEGVA